MEHKMRNGFQSNIGKLKDIDFYRICKVKLFRKILCKVKKFPIKFCKVIFFPYPVNFFCTLKNVQGHTLWEKNVQGQKIFFRILQGQNFFEPLPGPPNGPRPSAPHSILVMPL